MDAHHLVTCTFDRHADAILDIFNEAIVTSTALYDYEPRPSASMGPWFEAKRKGGFPVIGLEDSHGALLAFGSYGTVRAWPAYKYTVEHSVYVHKDQRGRGLGHAVMQGLIAAARRNEVHCMIGGIDATNAGSIALHEGSASATWAPSPRSASGSAGGSTWRSSSCCWIPRLNP